MTSETCTTLNNLNQNFYDKIARYWNNGDEYFWEGWDQIDLSRFGALETVRALDLGSGNARFANYLDVKLTNHLRYIGLDACDYLLEVARSRLKNSELTPQRHYSFLEEDVLTYDLHNVGEQHLITMFGLMHHIPGFEVRADLLRRAADMLTSGGLLVWTSWEFYNEPRLQKRIVNLTSEPGLTYLKELGLKLSDLEEGDHILDWVKKEFSLRYSHHFTKQEKELLCKKAGLKIIDEYVNDGKFSNRNGYVICEKIS